MKILQYLYYKIYVIFSKNELEVVGAYISVLIISLLFFFNILSIGGVLKKTDIIPKFINTKNEAIILIVSISIVNYLLFMHKKKYLKIKTRFENESELSNIIGWLLVFLYGFLTIILMFNVPLYRPGYV